MNGTAILYGDKITDSMRKAIDETERRRNRQIAHNLEHGITPHGVKKAIKDMIDGVYDPDEEKRVLRESKAKAEFGAMDEKSRAKTLKSLEKAMLDAARNLEFEKAAEMRDQLTKLKEEMFGVGHAGAR